MAFHATNKPGTCLWCGYKIPKAKVSKFFCKDGCEAAFAEVLAAAGRRLEPKDTDPPKKPRSKPVKKPPCPECGKPMFVWFMDYGDKPAANCHTQGCSNRCGANPIELNAAGTAWVLKATGGAA